MSGLLEGRGVLITGAGRGLGRAFAMAAAAEGAGVVVNDVDADEARTVAAEIEAAGGRAIAAAGSVVDWERAEVLVETCVTEFGAIDGLVNNAIAYSYFGPPWEENGDQIRKEVEVGVIGALNCGVHAMRRMRERRAGSIVNLTSRSALGVTGHSTYVAVKGAALSVTLGWALELMDDNVRVNALSPGAHTRAHDFAAAAGTIRATHKRNAVPPEVVAPAVVYLLSDLSSRITGQVVAMLGGRLGLLRHARVLPHMEERERWTAQEIAETIDRVYGEDLQPVGFEAEQYQWAPAPTP
jgi:NAD(P)-dependent dehydrogenase (short-subunit alcohol dehydrogenase family)